MPYKSTTHFIETLEQAGELIRIKTHVDTHLEMCEIVDRHSKTEGGGKALLFENTGTKFPVLMNAMGSKRRIEMALSTDDLNSVGARIETLFKQLTEPKHGLIDKLKLLPTLGQLSGYMPRSRSGRGLCQAVIQTDPDLGTLPVLTTWPADGGAFITLPGVNTVDPHTGIRNVGMYRMQVLDKNTTGMHWHRHKVGARHFNEYKELGQKMPIAVVLGGDPAYTYSATAPLPDNIDEYMLAGFLRQKKVTLVKCITQDIYVPEDADIILEGYVDPSEDFVLEGPFGDHTGYYSLADMYPKFHLTCITHRTDAVYPATIVGVPPMEDAWIALATERIFLAPIKLTMMPEFLDMDIPAAGVAHNLTIVQVKKQFPGHASKVMSALWGAGQMMFNKIMVVTDETAQIHNYIELARLVSAHVNPQYDIHLGQGPLDILDHSSARFSFGGKMGIDATRKMPEEIMEAYQPIPTVENPTQLAAALTEAFAEISGADLSLLGQQIAVAFIHYEKPAVNRFAEFATKVAAHESLAAAKLLVFVDPQVDIADIMTTVWIATNNIDPRRDCVIVPRHQASGFAKIALDGTRKTASQDNFRRDWPNIVVMNPKTIAKVDARWAEYGIGEFIPSPSLKFMPLVVNAGATVHEASTES